MLLDAFRFDSVVILQHTYTLRSTQQTRVGKGGFHYVSPSENHQAMRGGRLFAGPIHSVVLLIIESILQAIIFILNCK